MHWDLPSLELSLENESQTTKDSRENRLLAKTLERRIPRGSSRSRESLCFKNSIRPLRVNSPSFAPTSVPDFKYKPINLGFKED